MQHSLPPSLSLSLSLPLSLSPSLSLARPARMHPDHLCQLRTSRRAAMTLYVRVPTYYMYLVRV